MLADHVETSARRADMRPGDADAAAILGGRGQLPFADDERRALETVEESAEIGPGRAPALSGPTLSRPKESMCAMLPPPAPISIISITEVFTGKPEPFLNR